MTLLRRRVSAQASAWALLCGEDPGAMKTRKYSVRE